MKKQVFDKNNQFLHSEEGVPKCDEDFCDSCGDCLACYGEDICNLSESGKHIWVREER